MSVKVMSLVWDSFTTGGTDKLVMLAMADWCNDEGGSLHPSHDAVARKCCISRSQAVRVVRSLVADGWLDVVGNQFGGAPGATKQYRVNIQKLRETGSASATGSVDATGSTGATPTGSTHAPRRVAPRASTGSAHATQTTSEPPSEPPVNKAPAKPALFDARAVLTDCGVVDPVLTDWLSLRKKKRAPVTETAVDGIRREAAKASLSLHAALAMCCERGWQGFKAEWAENQARASPPMNRADERAKVGDVLTGRAGNERSHNAERDITGESYRVA